jgi:hypothetical protein
MKKKNTQRAEDERLLQEAGEYFGAEEIHAMQENALQNRNREILAPKLKALFEREVDDQYRESGDHNE